MAADPQLEDMLTQLKALDPIIERAQSRLRILDATNHPEAQNSRNILAQVISKRDNVARAIQAELNRP